MSQWNVPLTLEKAPSNGKEMLQARETEFPEQAPNKCKQEILFFPNFSSVITNFTSLCFVFLDTTDLFSSIWRETLTFL